MSEPASSPTVPTPASDADPPGSWVHVTDTKDLGRRRRKQVMVAGSPVALFLVDGEVFAVDDTCIHQQRSLSKGTLLGGQVICPGHQWKFDPRTGEPEDQDGCLATYPVQVTEEGAILVATRPATPRRETSVPASAATSASLSATESSR